MAPVIQELSRHSDQICSVVCSTGQHREMLDEALTLFNISPDHDLDVMTFDQSPAQVVAAILAKLEPILAIEQPDWVLVQGDTLSVMAASLAAFFNKIRVGHIEAGLRSFDKHQPYPEEVMRVIADVIADLHFAPTNRARENLVRTGIEPTTIQVTGNTVIDTLVQTAARAVRRDRVIAAIPADRRILLVTSHRRENFGQPIVDICDALLEIVSTYPDVHVVYPLHRNPNVVVPVSAHLGGHERISLLEPLSYDSFVDAMKSSYIILTDSGGVQEEAPSLGKPVLVLRNVTERPEGVTAGTVEVVGTNKPNIVRAVRILLDDSAAYHNMANAVNPYGDGHASERIVQAIIEYTGLS